MKRRRKVKGEQVITLQMTQQPKRKNINIVPGQLFCRQCKTKFLWRETNCIDDQDKVQSVTDTDNEFVIVKHQGKSFNQLAFHQSAYTHLWKI